MLSKSIIKKPKRTKRFKRCKYTFILEKDIVLQFSISNNKKSSKIIDKNISTCINCSEPIQYIDSNYINCKLKCVRTHSYGKMYKYNKPICISCCESLKNKSCPICEGNCFFSSKKKRFKKKKKCFAERQLIMNYKKDLEDRKKRRNRDWMNRELFTQLISEGHTSQQAKKIIINRGGICSCWYYN